jgi:hypothetical protein
MEEEKQESAETSNSISAILLKSRTDFAWF